MSIGPLGFFGSIASAPLSQAKAESDRKAVDSVNQASGLASAKDAEKAAGIGEAEKGHESSDRGGDGRSVLDLDSRGENEEEKPPPPKKSKDPTGRRGGNLDLSA